MLDHLEDMPFLNAIFGQSSTAAPSPKPQVKRRASPLKESPARNEEDETSDCPMEQVVAKNPSTSQQPDNVNMEQVDCDRDTDNDDDLDDEEQPLAGNPMPMPHPKLVPKSPPTTLRLMSKMKPAPKNILDEETESDNHPGDRPALPRRPAMRPADISLQREGVLILETNPEFHFIPEHERQHGAKVFWLKARFNDYWKPTLQGEGPHTEKQYMDFIKKVYSICCYTNAQAEVFWNRHHSDGMSQPPYRSREDRPER